MIIFKKLVQEFDRIYHAHHAWYTSVLNLTICDPYSLRSWILGTNAQKIVATTSCDSTIGCNTCTPARPAITPVNEGNIAAPA